jgi:hypothetical protein
MKYRILSALSLATVVLAIAACSGGSGSSTTSTTSTGQVVDAPVVGLKYVCGASSGLTDTAGNYTYTQGDSCTFSIGNVTIATLSSVPQDGIVTPQDLAVVLRSDTADLNVLAIAQFLQSINSGDTPGVITISSAVTAALSASSVPEQSILTDGLCFGSTSATNCQTKLAALVSTATAGKNALVSTATAKAALDAGMALAKVSNLKGLVQTTNASIEICESSNTTNGGQFALCAASSCVATGGQIPVTNLKGVTTYFTEMKCTCPVVTGPSIADVKGGNMQGSCATPSASTKYPNPIWSLFSTTASYPQESATPPFSSSSGSGQICPGTGTQMVTNCWSFECTIDPAQTLGVTTASCYCPLGENLTGDPVAANTPFFTEAGGAIDPATGKPSAVKQANACNSNPVGAPIALQSTH